MELEFEDGLLNFKILFLIAEKVLELPIFKSTLFHSMTVDGKKEFLKKLCTSEEGNLIISSCIIRLAIDSIF